MDFEYTYNKNHEDFPSLFYDSGAHLLTFGNHHGTAVIGEIAAKHNTLGVRGIVPNAQIGFQSAVYPSGLYYPHTAIENAVTKLRRGDVLLIEQQYSVGFNVSCSCSDACGNFGPLEVLPEVFDAIKFATRKGIIVVTAAGNGNVNLDDSRFDGWFNRNINDSGSIIVAASNSQRSPACFSTHGSRIDAHGLGSNVTTTGYGKGYNGGANKEYTYSFSGTSSATPMVAGAAVLIQSLLKAQNRDLLTPNEMRELFHSTGVGQSAAPSRYIAKFPNVLEAAEQYDLIPEDDILLLITPLLTLPTSVPNPSRNYE